jgi:sec-independent protein translocase protein TatA
MHLIMIVLIALIFFGPSKLAGLGKGLGDGIRGFKDALKEGTEPSVQPDSAVLDQGGHRGPDDPVLMAAAPDKEPGTP